MIDILIISDQPRLQGILAKAGALPDGTLRSASSLHQGLALMSAQAPDILFLQNRLSGLAGYILVRHVREEAGAAATKIVLLTDGADTVENSTADIELATGVADNELVDAIAEIIADLLERPRTTVQPPATASKPLPAELPPPPAPDVADSVSLSRQSGAATRPAGAIAPSPQEPAVQATVLSSSPPPIQWERKRLLAACAAAGVLVVVLLALYLIRSPGTKIVPAGVPVQPLRSSASRPVQAAHTSSGMPAPQPGPAQPPLPSFVPAAAADPRYAAANPGWERYTSAARDYRIFREAGNLKAIQVIGKSADGIPSAFFTSVIKELAQVRDYKTGSREMKGEYLVKKGKLSQAADIIIYKDRSDTQLRAFVITFTTQENHPAGKGHQ